MARHGLRLQPLLQLGVRRRLIGRVAAADAAGLVRDVVGGRLRRRLESCELEFRGAGDGDFGLATRSPAISRGFVPLPRGLDQC